MKCRALFTQLRDSVVSGELLLKSCSVLCLLSATAMWIFFSWALPFFEVPYLYRCVIIISYICGSFVNWLFLRKGERSFLAEAMMPMNANVIFWVAFFASFMQTVGFYMLIFGGTVFLVGMMMNIIWTIRYNVSTSFSLSEWWIRTNVLVMASILIVTIPLVLANLIGMLA